MGLGWGGFIHTEYGILAMKFSRLILGEIAAVHQYCLALVRGEKEMEIALQEGKYPVIDIMTDVFAIPSAAGESFEKTLRHCVIMV